MRWAPLLAGLIVVALQAGCDRTPELLGITGPAPPVPPTVTPDEATVPTPGLPSAGANSGAEQRYYNYN